MKSITRKTRRVPTASARERILHVASDLFYTHGYRATGINEVIQKSGVAKATFYNHFPTKDDLCLAYLEELKADEMAVVDTSVASADGPVARFLAVVQSLEPWLLKTKFRGCAFLNMASEIPDHKSPLRKPGIKVYDYIRNQIHQLSLELIASDKKKYGHLNDQDLTDDYLMIFSGAILLSEIYHNIWPVERALAATRRLIGE